MKKIIEKIHNFTEHYSNHIGIFTMMLVVMSIPFFILFTEATVSHYKSVSSWSPICQQLDMSEELEDGKLTTFEILVLQQNCNKIEKDSILAGLKSQ